MDYSTQKREKASEMARQQASKEEKSLSQKQGSAKHLIFDAQRMRMIP